MKRALFLSISIGLCCAISSVFVGEWIYLVMHSKLQMWVAFSGKITAVADYSRGITNDCRVGPESTIRYEQATTSTNLAGIRYWSVKDPSDKAFVEIYNNRMHELITSSKLKN